MRRPEPLKGAMKAALKGLNLDQRMRESQAMALWADVVGETTAARTRPLYVNRGTLVVAVASSAWANQLNLMKTTLLKALEERCGRGVIRDLRWKTSGLDGADGVDGEGFAMYVAPVRRGGRAEETPLSAGDQEAIARLTDGVTDPKLAEGFERLLAAKVRRRQRLSAQGWVACQKCGCLCEPPGSATALPDGAPAPDAAIDALARAKLCPVCRLELNALLGT